MRAAKYETCFIFHQALVKKAWTSNVHYFLVDVSFCIEIALTQ